MSTTRREFLAQAGAASAAIAAMAVAGSAAAAAPARQPKRILLLGGTGFLGPHLVWDALEQGHTITLFNRGKTDPGLFPDIETIIGDRYADYSGLEEAVADGRTWDAVIDTFAYVPKVVEDAIGVLGGAIGQYVTISTMSVYASNDTPGADERDAIATISDEAAAAIPTHREVGAAYGSMKARCEMAAEQLMPGRATSLRPGLICGARDTTGRFTYWPVRASEGGTMIAPNTPNDPMQIIDVRDLARFTIRTIEQQHVGAYNVITPEGTLTTGDVVSGSINAAKAASGVETETEWISAEFLGEQGVQPWQHMPAWVPPTLSGYAGFGRQSSKKAHDAGLTCRPVQETAAYALAYYTNRGAEITAEEGAETGTQWQARVRGGLPAEREKQVLEAWNARNG
ncbi:MAG: NAD-dependent epimerase/dehydratase family protein [Planctomycetota bacterium]